MDPAYGERYRELYRHHWWWRAREEMVLELLERSAPEGGFGPILDVGCGDALLFARLRAFGSPRGVEPDASLLCDETRASGDVHVGPFDAGFRPAERFGLILMLDVLEHLDDDVAALGHARSLLRPDGLLLITVPAFRALWTAHDDWNHHRTRYDRRQLERSVHLAGLELEEARYAFHWLAPVKLLVRAREGLARRLGGSRPAALPSVPPRAWNRLLFRLCRLEQASWGRLPWPFGSSLVAVARRPVSAAGRPRG